MIAKQVFLYRKGTALNKADLAALREAGFVPIQVANFDDVRVIDSINEASRSDIWLAAMEAIAGADKGSNPSVRQMFGTKLAEAMRDTGLAIKQGKAP